MKSDNKTHNLEEPTEIAERVRDRCVEAALNAYEEAGISGLCAEGRWEMAIQAIRCLDLDAILQSAPGSDKTDD